ncbi:transcription factor LBX2 [Phaenicophaeus curvirostris]|uniref:transcription factor LBX2 n=1 Tax=Phaenicophaeus curvirostris TaxID=33595 RepID=UPI0037F0C290
MSSVREPAGPPPPPAPPGLSAKPLTPFGIEDILGPPRRAPPRPRAASPLRALQELASKTFRGLEGAPGPGRSPPAPPAPSRRRRRSRTAFSAAQLQALEQRFGRSRYLGPADRDALAARLALSSAQVLTWFQNRRAKLKRDLDELRADVATLRGLPPAALGALGALGPGTPDPPPPPAPRAASTDPEEIDVGD